VHTLLFVIAALLASGPGDAPAPEDLLAASGPGLKGWTRLPIPSDGKVKPESPWSYDPATGVLTCKGKGHHEWLRLDREVGDFVFRVEWRFVPEPDARGYNSGVMVRNSADGRAWHQAQTGDRSGGYLFGETPADGKLRGFKAGPDPADGAVKPAGEWNTYEITCIGDELVLRTNGRETSRFDACGQARGHVGLEAEGYTIEFRNVTIEPR
jgi:hypothetical protein